MGGGVDSEADDGDWTQNHLDAWWGKALPALFGPRSECRESPVVIFPTQSEPFLWPADGPELRRANDITATNHEAIYPPSVQAHPTPSTTGSLTSPDAALAKNFKKNHDKPRVGIQSSEPPRN